MNRRVRSNEVLVAVTIVGLCLIVGISNPVFFTVGNIFDLMRSSIVMGIFAMGVLIVIVSGGIDVSFTAIAVFALYSTVRLLNAYAPEAPFWLAFVIAGAIGFGLGMINAFFIARFNLPTLIVTLGTMSMFHGFLLFAIGNTIVRDLPPSLTAFSRATLVQVQMERGVANLHPAIFFTAVIAVLVWLLMDFTMLGRGVYALGGARRGGAGRLQYPAHSVLHLWPGGVKLSGFGGMIYGSLNRQANPQDIVGSELNVIAP